MKRPSGKRDKSTSARSGLEIARCGFTGRPSSSQAWKYLPSSWKCAASSRASTVFGWVPAATNTVLRVLAREHRVRLGPGGDEHGVPRQPLLGGFAAQSA